MQTSIEGCNTVVLVGTLSSEPRRSELGSGTVLIRLEVTTPGTDGGRADSVPVAWFDPPARSGALAAGDGVVVVGRVRRRWFGGPGGARSATEVVAHEVLPVGRRAAVRRAVEQAAAALAVP